MAEAIYLKKDGNGEEIAKSCALPENPVTAIYKSSVGSFTNMGVQETTYIMVTKDSSGGWGGNIHGGSYSSSEQSCPSRSGVYKYGSVGHELLGMNSNSVPNITYFSGSPGRYNNNYTIGGYYGINVNGGYAFLYNTHSSSTFNGVPHIVGEGNMGLSDSNSTTLASYFNITLPA